MAACLMIFAFPFHAQQGGMDPFRRGGTDPTGSQKPGVIASVEFVQTDITTIFKMISDLTGWSIVMSPELSKAPPKINIWIKNLTPDQVLQHVASLAGLVLERQGNTVQVMTFDEYVTSRGVEKKVLSLKHGDAKEIAASLQPFVDDKQGGKVLADGSSNQIILLMPTPLMDSLIQLVGRLDTPYARDQVRVVRLIHLEAREIIPDLEEFLTQSATRGENTAARTVKSDAAAGSEDAPQAGQDWLVRFMVEPKLNAVVLRGLREDVERAAELISQLDVPTQIMTIGYQLQYTNAEEVFETLEDIVEESLRRRGGDEADARLRVAASEQNNRIIVEGSQKDQAKIASVINAIDQPLPPGTGGMRVYRLENASAREVAQVIQELIEERNRRDQLARQQRSARSSGQSTGGFQAGAAAQPPTPGGAVGDGAPGGGAAESSAGDVLPARVTAAEEINAVIIRASAAEQDEYSAVIRDMDQPRDQVLLEVTVVTVRNDDSLDLGVEVFGRIGISGTEILGFTNFTSREIGAGTVDQSEEEQDSPLGLNLGIFNSDDLSIVLNALKTVGETRIASAPRLLVQDNAEAELRQIAQEPFEVISQSDSSTITSFGGFVDAGTSLLVVPHISDDDWLRLDYEVTLSSFGVRTAEQLEANLPPPRRENTSRGTVRVPNEYVVVLGGLTSTREDETVSSVPILGDIPLMGNLFKNRTTTRFKETLFIFVRPIALRDPAFRDLLSLSRAQARQAKVAADVPMNPLKFFVSLDTEEPAE